MNVITSMEQNNNHVVSRLPYYPTKITMKSLEKIQDITMLVCLEEQYDLFLESNSQRLALLKLDNILEEFIDLRNKIFQQKQKVKRERYKKRSLRL
jgi:hypothetical protein